MENKRPPKSEWGPGPWQDEEDAVHWTDDATGYACMVLRGPVGSLCGHVGVPAEHRFHGASYNTVIPETDATRAALERPIGNMGPMTIFTASLAGEGSIRLDVLFDVHGSLTYSGKRLDGVEDDRHWFGFDCGHSGDLSPQLSATMRGLGMDRDRGDEYRTMDYVRAECTKLATQLHAFSS